VSAVDRIGKRIAKEAAEAEVAYAKALQERDARYQKMDALLARYDEEQRRSPYSISDEAHHIWRHLVDEYQWDLVAMYRRVREGKQP
jgi:hypothetical protein